MIFFLFKQIFQFEKSIFSLLDFLAGPLDLHFKEDL